MIRTCHQKTNFLRNFLFLWLIKPSFQILELLEAQQLPSNKANKMMRRIMRKLPPETLEQLFKIYKETRNSWKHDTSEVDVSSPLFPW